MPPVTQTIHVTVLFFGPIREILGRAQESIEVADGSSIEDLFRSIAIRNSQLQKFCSSLVASRNQEFTSWKTPLRHGDEIAFLPPVSGG